MYYVIFKSKHQTQIEDSFVEFEQAKEYIIYKTLDEWCARNDFVTPLPFDWLVVTIPVGYLPSDNKFFAYPIFVYQHESLKWFPEWNFNSKKNREILIQWLRQTKQITYHTTTLN